MSCAPCYFSPLSEIPGPIELLENSLTYEGVQWRKTTECVTDLVICSHFREGKPYSRRNMVLPFCIPINP